MLNYQSNLLCYPQFIPLIRYFSQFLNVLVSHTHFNWFT